MQVPLWLALQQCIKGADRFSAGGCLEALCLLHHGEIYVHVAKDQMQITCELGDRAFLKTF